MKKNLFLTLALAFAGFAGVNAQEWSQTLGAGDGLPGENVQKGTTTVQVFKSDVIKPTEALTTLRFTVAQNYNGEQPNGNNFVTALSELVVYAADGETVIPYTATSNADHNTLSGGSDGAGIAALNDGNWNNYWHSNWSSNAVTEFHHLELTFEAPVSEFILEWGARPGNPKNAPTLVGLTPGGVDYVPYSDWAFTMGNEITSMDQLLAAKYFVMKGNNPVEYNQYINNHESTEGAFGKQTNEEPLVGPGPQYVAPGVAADEAEPSYAIQLIPAEGGYYIYYVTQGMFMAGSWNGANGEITKTSKLSEAAIVKINEVNGKFEMNFDLEYTDANDKTETLDIHVGARVNNGNLKTVDHDRYQFFKSGKDYCLNFGYLISFDWTLQEVAMNYPANYTSVAARNAVKEAKSIYTFMDSVAVEGYEQFYDAFIGTLNSVEAKVASNSYTNIMDVFTDVNSLNSASAMYVLSKVVWYSQNFYNEFATEYGDSLSTAADPIENTYSQEAFQDYIQNKIYTEGAALMTAAVADPYAHIAEMKTYLNNAPEYVKAFLATKIAYVKFPTIYSAENPHQTPLGSKIGNHYDWEKQIVLEKGKTVNGIRLTFLETNVGTAASDGKYKGYAMVALSGLEIYAANGEKLALTSELVGTNSLETSEGSLANLFDDDVATFYHSIWGNGTFNPAGYVYLDIAFPAGKELNSFTIKTIGRNNGSLAPGTVCISNYGEVYDPAIFRENPYAVAMVEQITDASKIEEGIYILSGNLRAKTQGAASRYYSGVAPYHTDVRAAVNDPCVYMFKKVANGWNIISLANAQYWALNKEVNENTNEETGETTVSTSYSTGLTVYPSNAAVVNFVESQNLANTFVIYSETEENVINASFSWTNPNDEADVVTVDETPVNANKFVFMDWDSYLAGRPCASILPGDITYLSDDIQNLINNHNKAQDFKNGDGYSAGDYLHFNKANGEGEWNIYKVTMNDPYYLWANNIGETLNDLGLVAGKNPGNITGDIAALQAAIKNVDAVVASENKAGAQAAVETFVNNVEMAQTAERVKVEHNYWYAIESAYTEYYKQQNKIKAIYATEAGLAWMDAPASYNRGNNPEFIFQFQKYEGTTDENGVAIPEADADNAFLIYNEALEMWACTGDGTTQVTMGDDFSAAVYIIKPLKNDIYTIYANGADPLHTAGHGNGAGGQGTIVNWTGDAGSASSWTLRFVDDAEGTSINDLVVEKGEIVSVGYFTPAGAAIPAPVNGVNIVVTVYSNGVIETKKVLVK